MKKSIKIYRVSTCFSSREIQARSAKEAVQIFKSQLKGLISSNDKINVY